MKLATGRNVKYLLLAHFLFFILIALYCLFIIEKPAVHVLVPPYILMSALTIYSLLFLPISAGALFVLIILANKNRSPEGRRKDGAVFLTSTIPTLLPTLIIYIFLVFFAEPLLLERRNWFHELSRAGESYLREAERSLSTGNIEEALIFIDLYLHIDPNSARANDIRSDILIAWPNLVLTDEISEERIEAVSGDFLTGQKLIEVAERFYAMGHYSSAAYFARMAGVFRNSSIQADEIARRAMVRLSGFFPDTSLEERLFDGKVNIVNFIATGNLHDAYHFYHMLSEQFPYDQELSDMGRNLFSLLAENSFFYEDIRSIYFAPGKRGIAFVNSNSSGKELVFANRIVFTGDAVYFFDINIISLSPAGQIVRHIKSLYGKLIGNSLVMQCLGREKKLLIYPEVIVGNRNDRISSIELGIPRNAIVYMGLEENRLLKVRTYFLFENLALLSDTGSGKYAPVQTLFIRFIRVFNYILMLVLVTASGISFLKRRTDKSYLSLILLPIAVTAIYFLEGSIMYLKNRILLIFMKEIGILPAALCLMAIIAIALATAIYYTIIKASYIEGYKE